MYKFISLVVLSLVLFYNSVRSSDIVVDNLKVFVDDEEFFIKAICYNPVPLGIATLASSGFGGGGYCSAKETPAGDYKSACYDSDFYDGSQDNPLRSPPGPASWFLAIWQRDFPLIQQLGANTLRVYNTNPTTRQATLNPANGLLPFGKDHIPFFDLAATYGFKIIWALYADATFLAGGNTTLLQQYLRWQIDEVGNHTALLMFTFGNELNLYGVPSLIPIVNNAIAYAKSYLLSKWGRIVPFTTAVVDDPPSYPTLVQALNVDVFTTNAGYRGFSFSDLWSNPTTGLYALSCQYNKPVFIGEIGFLSFNNSATQLYPNWVNQVWKDLVGHIDEGCVGGAFFEYSDEPYTKADINQQALGVVALSVIDGSDQPNVFVADLATKKDIIFAALASGTYEGDYNMNADAFTLIGRSPYTLTETQPSVCPASSKRKSIFKPNDL